MEPDYTKPETVDLSNMIKPGDIDPAKTSVSSVNLRPVGGNVMIKIDPLPEKTESGLLYMPVDSRAIDYLYGTVIAVGPGVYAKKTGLRMTPDVKAGDRVVIGRYTGAEFTHEGQAYKICFEKDEEVSFT